MAKTMLLYGESGTFKSSNLGECADMIYSLTGKRTRLITADSGFEPMREQIDRGIIEPWDLTTYPNPLSGIMKASRGFWPVRFTDTRVGFADAESGLTTTDDWSDIGLIIVEGFYMLAELLKRDLVNKGRDSGAKAFNEDGLHFSSSSLGAYGFVQDTTKEYVGNFKSLPADWIIFTTHEGKGSDQVSKRTTFGPAVAGSAVTDKVVGWVEYSFHLESTMYDAGEGRMKRGVRAYFERHPDPDVPNIFWPAKLGVTPRQAAYVRSIWPEGYIPLLMDKCGNYISGIHTFIDVLSNYENRNLGLEAQTPVPFIDETAIINPGDGNN